jgi:sulfur carrier protein
MLVIQTKGKVVWCNASVFIPKADLFLFMNITVNNKTHYLQNAFSIESMVLELKLETRGIAIAINQSVVPKKDWSQTKLEENDNITIIKATQGG